MKKFICKITYEGLVLASEASSERELIDDN